MKVSVDISMYPLHEDYCQPIIEFIAALEKEPSVQIERNSMSTHIYGNYAPVMALLNREMLKALQTLPQTVFVLKLLGTDRQKANIRACE
ncbi:MAG: hypothetical protein JXR44_00435 [Thiotrichales bacterium]|nr:hypothetical protein [Thiotrichales bacterium]